MDKVSIIVPVYNVELYIRKCLDSVINQTHTNLEILLVDDGSTDNSGQICDEYATKDNRIKVVHKANGGLSSARNAGLKICTGDYIGFVDSDDWIEPDMYEVLHKALTNNHVQLSCVNLTRDTENASVVNVGREEIPKRVLTQKEMLLYVLRGKFYARFSSSVCNKLFSAELINTSDFWFDENINYAEDVKFIACLIANNNIAGVHVNKPLYHYVQRQESLAHSDICIQAPYLLNAYRDIVEATNKHEFSDISIWPKRDYSYNASLLVEKALKDNDKELLFQMSGEMKRYLKEYIEANSEYPERLERIKILMERDIADGKRN